MVRAEHLRVSAKLSVGAVLCASGLTAALLAGCSNGKSFRDIFAGNSGGSEEGTFYAGVSGLKVYAKPRSSSAARGTLALHEKVYRIAIENGFAYVKVAGSGEKGWVENAKLLWRLPAAKSPPAAPVSAAETVEPEPEPVSVEAPVESPEQAVPSAPAGGEEEDDGAQGADPSIFNPY